MSDPDLPYAWSRRFGLALAPLFEAGEVAEAATHHVLLDGGFGTFALSTSTEKIWEEVDPAAWVWSGDIPHHVTITPAEVAVLRWDQPDDPRIFSRSSVEKNLDGFYEFLTKDKLRSTNSVVDHLLTFFRRVRTLNHAAGSPDDRATDIFLATLAGMMWPEQKITSQAYGLAEDISILQHKLDPNALKATIEEASRSSASRKLLQLYPSLAVRHAGGQLFQEAHFELLRAAASPDLFGIVDVPEVAKTTRGGIHYTPPALARVLVEQALNAIDDLGGRQTFTICDPACGSGAFLHEALRALRRTGFSGRLRIVGQDISGIAISMARFAISAALRDWEPAGGTELKLEVGDSLGELGIPPSDLIVMNPPFIGFGAQSELQRHQLREAVGAESAARGDLSMAFVVRALSALKHNGAMGTLFPASLLSLKAATMWREQIAEAGDVRLLGSIGDFGLFSHAQVQVACAVVRKAQASSQSQFTALVTGNDAQSTGEAFRCLRKLDGTVAARVEEQWKIFPLPSSQLVSRPTWRFPSPDIERALRSLIADNFPPRWGIYSTSDRVFRQD